MDKSIKRVRALYRVSSQKQLNTEEDIPVQRNACMAFIRGKADWVFDGEYLEKGVSGYKCSAENRDVIQEVKRDAEQKKFDVLLVFLFDRLGRIEDETPFMLKWFTEQGIEVWSVKEGEQKFENHVDDLLNYIRFWQAGGESCKTSLRVDEAMKQMALEGKYFGGRPKYGYAVVPTGEMTKKKLPEMKLVIKEEEAAVVRKIFEWAAYENMGIHRIAKRLNEQAVKASGGGQWNACTIAYLLSNPIYKGYLVYGRTTQKGRTKQHRTPKEQWSMPKQANPELVIVTEKLWNQVRANRDGIIAEQTEQHLRNLERAPLKLGRTKLLLIGLIRCGFCGAAMTTAYTTARWTTADGMHHRVNKPVYRCLTQTSGQLGCKGRRTTTAEQVETVVLEELGGYLDRLKPLDLTGEITRLQRNHSSNEEQLVRNLRREKIKMEKEQKSLHSEVIKAIRGESAFDGKLLNELIAEKNTAAAELDQQLIKAEEQLEQQKARKQNPTMLQNTHPIWREEFEAIAVAQKKVLLAKLIREVIVYQDRIELTLQMHLTDFLQNGRIP